MSYPNSFPDRREGTGPSTSNPASHRSWLAALLLRQPDLFLARLRAGLMRFHLLPRGLRRRLRRWWAAGAVGTALLLGVVAGAARPPAAHAATITVDGTICTLADAIRSANTDAAAGGCITGDPGLDTIDLQADVTLTVSSGNYWGPTGLPAVTSEIVIEGNGHTIARDGAAPQFRILYVGATGDLTLNDVTISGGHTTYDGGGFHIRYGTMAVNDSTISDNYALIGGGGRNQGGNLTITDTVFRGNDSSFGGGALYQDQDNSGPLTVETTISGSLFELNDADGAGGAIYNDLGPMTITDTTFIDNEARYGGAIFSYYPESLITITGSTLADNRADYGGGVFVRGGTLTLINSTVSGNSATVWDGGGIYNYHGHVNLTNTTVTGNDAIYEGGGILQAGDTATLTLSRSIVSGNLAIFGITNEVRVEYGTATADDYNVFSRNDQTTAVAFYNFTPGASDFDASSDAGNVALTDILDTTLANNGGPTDTHNLVLGSPALDFAPDADCIAAPTGGVDQRGFVRPFDVAGQGNEGSDTCDAGAVEYGSAPADTVVFLSTRAAGTTGDGLDFGPEDVILWDGAAWSLFFDGSAAGLTPFNAKHNVSAFWIPDPAEEDVVLSFGQNRRAVPGISGRVNGMDLVWWDGSAFSLFFDGEDVDLTNKTQEKIDALHILPGAMSPVGGSCLHYLLISTQGPGRVSNQGEPSIRFGGEDVLGFCMTNDGDATAGFWHLLLDGSAEGMPRNSTDSISFSDDGQTMYLTTQGPFAVDSAVGGHSMVYEYDFGTGEFSGPFFSAPAEGLPEKVNGLQVEGELD